MKELLDLLLDYKSGGEAGNCFEVAYRIVSSPMFEALCKSQRKPVVLSEKSPFRVVHGLPIGQGPENKGKRYWHAWVELDGLVRSDGGVVHGRATVVLDYSNGHRIQMLRQRYYDIGKLDEEHVFRYTPAEARKLAKKQNSCGPWVPNYEAMEEV